MAKTRYRQDALLMTLNDGEWHCIDDLQNTLNIDRTSIYNAMHNLKKRNLIISNNCGSYRLSTDNIEESISDLKKVIEYYKNFKWYAATDRELTQARRGVIELINLAQEINTVFR